jgi:putative salt-induced outer membrane protein YdiY
MVKAVPFLLMQVVPVPPPVPVPVDTLPPPAAVQEAPARADSTPPRPAPVPDRWATALDIGFASSSGNSDLTSLTTGIRFRHLQTSAFKLDWTATFRYGESQGAVVARNLHSKLEFDMGPGKRVSPFIFASGERDPFRRLDLRTRTGSGVRYSLLPRRSGETALRLAAQYSHERFTPEADLDARSDAGWSAEFSGFQELGNTLRLENSTLFDPVFKDLGDYNLEVKSKLVSRISQRLALTLTHTYSYDSRPPLDVGTTDQRFQAGLTIEL